MPSPHPAAAKTCPRCRSRNTRPSRTDVPEALLRLLLVRPYRCQECLDRFWRFFRPVPRRLG